MRVSLAWLEDYVRVDVPVAKLRELLDLSGTKVEAIHRPGEGAQGVVVVEVVEVAEHPNADNLVLVDVTTGAEQTRVVCGARNFAPGDRVPYARVGSTLPGGLRISERKIRGEPSAGMLCSGAELGVSRDHAGILVLPPEATIGEDVTSILGLGDTILELEITPDRPDCMSMVGIAREVATLLGNELKLPATDLAPADDLVSPVKVDIEDAEGCPRYLARYLEGISVGRSPASLVRRLLSAGFRPISNVVDVTNYVLLELGHPLHAFDASGIHDHHIVVRRARDREPFVTLDGIERQLHRDDLMIADPKKPLALAGVMGGELSEVSDRTTSLILESAYFDPRSIAYTTRRHQMRTEASSRFERGADPEAVPAAAARAARLIVELAGGRVSHVETDAYPVTIGRRTVGLRARRTEEVLGFPIRADAQAGYLRSIGLEVKIADDLIETVVPTFRPDIRREEDLIEEVARLAGFDRLPSTVPQGPAGGLDERQATERRIRRALAGMGLKEAWTSSFGSPRALDAIGLAPDHPARSMVMLANPTSDEEPALRTTLVPDLLRSVAINAAQRATQVALFELARVYEPVGEQLPREASVIAAAFAGSRRMGSWIDGEEPWDFFAAKGVLEALLRALGIDGVSFQAVRGIPFHPSRASEVSLGEARLGVLGEIHPDACAAMDVPEGTVVFELSLAPILEEMPGPPRVGELPRFPAVYLDMAVVVDEEVPAGRVQELILSHGSPEVRSARLFDVYRGAQISPGSKSLAFALEIRVSDRTLTEEEALAVRDRIVEQLAAVGAKLRA